MIENLFYRITCRGVRVAPLLNKSKPAILSSSFDRISMLCMQSRSAVCEDVPLRTRCRHQLLTGPHFSQTPKIRFVGPKLMMSQVRRAWTGRPALQGLKASRAGGGERCAQVPDYSLLMNANVARAGFNAHCWAAAVDLADDVVAVLRSLRQHLLIGMDAARAGGCVERKCSAAG